MIKVGILGCGKIAQVRHIPEYDENPCCELVGFFNPTRSRAEDMAAKYGGKVYDTADELLADPEIDADALETARRYLARLGFPPAVVRVPRFDVGGPYPDVDFSEIF